MSVFQESEKKSRETIQETQIEKIKKREHKFQVCVLFFSQFPRTYKLQHKLAIPTHVQVATGHVLMP